LNIPVGNEGADSFRSLARQKVDGRPGYRDGHHVVLGGNCLANGYSCLGWNVAQLAQNVAGIGFEKLRNGSNKFLGGELAATEVTPIRHGGFHIQLPSVDIEGNTGVSPRFS
jgi:hypothetical protein